ncbi:hypothetical protein MKX03_016694 [Papaver bracteatum]|nr:hypothetical protein MKX03_016694 [Papaver bracteatum]
MFIPLVLFFLIFLSSSAESATIEQGKPGCLTKCGNITIPYPFGDYGEDCSMIEDDAGKLYYVYCNTSFEPPKAFLGMNDDKLEVLSISDTEFRVKNTAIAAKCYDDQTGKLVVDNPSYNLNLRSTPFTISYTKNMYAGVGCNIFAGFYGTSRGCVSECANKEDIVEGACSGSGCCQANIQKGLNNISEAIQNVTSEFPIQSFSQCNFAFLVETGQYTFQSSDLQLDGRLTKPDMNLPVVLDWAIGGRSCKEAQTISSDIASDRYACKNNTVCSNAPDNPGYRCACEKGYEGNPYLGCQDINECEDEKNPCYGTCTNTIGGYNCSACPEGTNGDGRKDGTSCTTVSKDGFPVLWVALGEKTLCMERSEEQRSLTTYFLSLAVKNEEFKIIASPVDDGQLQQVRAVIEIAKKCLKWKGGERPPMKKIAADLQSLEKFNSVGWDSQPLYHEETTDFPSEMKNFYSNIPSNLFDHSSMYTSETNVDLSIMSPR